jgi:outer membrane protein assembly factor BamE (lipoprotein component of BamABCDE complex)
MYLYGLRRLFIFDLITLFSCRIQKEFPYYPVLALFSGPSGRIKDNDNTDFHLLMKVFRMIYIPVKKLALLTGTGLLALHMAACTPTIETRGNLLSTAKLEQISPETSIQADVARLWGPPTTVSPFDPKTWYYIGETTSQKGIFEAEVDERQIIKVTFDENNTVTEVAAIDPKQAREVDFSDRRTPTAGREFTAFEQFVGNLGKFNNNIKTQKAKIPGM